MMLWVILSPFITAAFAPVICRFTGRFAPWVLGIVPLAIFAYVAINFPLVTNQSVASGGLDWFPQYGVRIDYRLDALSAIFAMLISGIGFLVVIYAGGYFGPQAKTGRFFCFLFAFMGAMLGVVLSDNVMGMFIFWELTSVTSFLLIGYKHATKASRDSAYQALLVTGVGGLALFAGLILMVLAAIDLGLSQTQAMQISQLTRVDLLTHPTYPVFLGLILAGAFTKSAQFPFHFWLPGAMAAPTPVSSYLHSATMVKAGVYLLARMLPVLGGSQLWFFGVTGFGLVTMIVGASLALMQKDIKLVLAYTTVSVLGTLTFLLGLGHEAAVTACVVYLIAHALYKAAMFQVAGIIDVKTGTRDITILSGLMQRMPLTMVVAVLAAVSMAGLPPFFGFYGKELLYAATLQHGAWSWLLAASCLVAAIFTVVAALLVGFGPFVGAPGITPKQASDASFMMLLGPATLAVAGTILGIAPFIIDKSYLSAIASSIAAHPTQIKLALWHGTQGEAGIVLALSAATFALGGFMLWYHRRRIPALNLVLSQLGRFGPQSAYERGLSFVFREIARLTVFIQHGYLRRYIAVTVLVTVALTAWPILRELAAIGVPVDDFVFLPLDLAIILMMIAGISFIALTHKRLSAVASLGLVGLAVVLLFTLFSAPDLAITQVLVEILTVILFVGVFYHLPGLGNFTSFAGRARDLLIASSIGILMTIFVLAAQTVRLDAPLTEYFAEHSVVTAYGRNVVNVVLVDFRAIDTFGEIVVVAVAGFGVFALLSRKLARRKPE